ncbi:response regulator transcription factor [Streptomyces sp. NBC_00019]|uniref:response regulator transcription factor n=1 Tax=Streptomyces sp. NBC_00019 TaxID=2975623 RepID=UPI003252683C
MSWKTSTMTIRTTRSGCRRAVFRPLPARVRRERQAVLVSGTSTELPYGLSPRELEVLTRAARGQTNQAIAQALFLSPRTVHSHIEHLLRKTGCASRAEATALCVRDGVLRPTSDDVEHFVETGAFTGRGSRSPR